MITFREQFRGKRCPCRRKRRTTIVVTLNFNMHALFELLYLLCQSNTLVRDKVCSHGIALHGGPEQIKCLCLNNAKFGEDCDVRFLFNAHCCGLAVTRPSNIRHKRSSEKDSNCSSGVSLSTHHGNMLQINIVCLTSLWILHHVGRTTSPVTF